MLFATKMEDTNERSRPAQTIMTPKHLSCSVWKYLLLYTVDGKKQSCLSTLYKAAILLHDDNKSADLLASL